MTHDCPAELAPGAWCELQVRVRPAVQGLVRAAVEIASPALATPVYAAIAGLGAVQQPSTLVWLQAAPLRFGSEQRRVLALANPGPMPAILGQTSIVGPNASLFSVENGCAPGAMVVAGTSCDMTVVYRPSLLPAAQAVLQLRSDQSNPASVALEGGAAQAAPEPGPAAGGSGGGCSVGPPDRKTVDPLLLLLALLAAVSLARARRAGG